MIRVGVMGAGAIGVFLGLHAAAGGAKVTLIGRRALVDARAELRALRLDGAELRPPADLEVAEEPEALADADVVLVTVKSRDTAAVGERLAAIVPAGAAVVSFQNGLGNLHRLGRSLGPRVVAGMVSFNVVREGGLYRQATTGPLIAGRGDPSRAPLLRALERAMAAAGLGLDLRGDVDDVVAGKLLLNLSNGVGAATGLPIAATLRSRDARWCFAQCIAEGLPALRRAGYSPRNIIGLPPGVIAWALRLPDFVVMRVARRMIDIDPKARSSTLQDLDAGKPTEIGELNGAIADLARAHGLRAPANQAIATVIRELEVAPRPLAFLSPAELRARIAAAEALPGVRI
ncbi:MAG: 2-dehydropantoate 2-reductase [Nannocystaceae bacterium]